jgi:hypothetical protein
MHTTTRRLQRWTAALCGALALLSTATSRAAPVTLAFSSSSTAVHEYFALDPAISALAQVRGRSGSWAVDTVGETRVTLASLWLASGPAVPECCTAEAHDFVFDLTVAGVTQALTARVQAMEVANDQYQFDLLAAPDWLFDLGGIGTLRLRLVTGAGQMPANQPFYESGYLYAMAQWVDTPHAVPLPGTLALVLPGLVALGLCRRRVRACRRLG